jgi:hypothetical protein
VWAVAEVGRSAQEEWANGGQADAILVDNSGRTVATAHADVMAGVTSARLALTSQTLLAGEYQLQFRTKGARATAPSTDVVRIAVAPAPQSTGAVFFRRGPTTANRDVPTADLRFRRSDRLRVDVPSPGAETVTARLLDRAGSPMAIPVSATGARFRPCAMAISGSGARTAGARRLRNGGRRGYKQDARRVPCRSLSRDAPQTQRVRNHRDRTETHCRRGDHGTQ